MLSQCQGRREYRRTTLLGPWPAITDSEAAEDDPRTLIAGAASPQGGCVREGHVTANAAFGNAASAVTVAASRG